MLYADDAGIVSRSLEERERMMPVITTACLALGLTISESNTEIVCLQIKGEGKSHATTEMHQFCSVEKVSTLMSSVLHTLTGFEKYRKCIPDEPIYGLGVQTILMATASKGHADDFGIDEPRHFRNHNVLRATSAVERAERVVCHRCSWPGMRT